MHSLSVQICVDIFPRGVSRSCQTVMRMLPKHFYTFLHDSVGRIRPTIKGLQVQEIFLTLFDFTRMSLLIKSYPKTLKCASKPHFLLGVQVKEKSSFQVGRFEKKMDGLSPQVWFMSTREHIHATYCRHLNPGIPRNFWGCLRVSFRRTSPR